jgi:hypothetical protein
VLHVNENHNHKRVEQASLKACSTLSFLFFPFDETAAAEAKRKKLAAIS